MEPKLTPPGSKRLKLNSDEPLSSFGFEFNLRRYSMADYQVSLSAGRHAGPTNVVGQWQLTL
jgi:hypothetical protein